MKKYIVSALLISLIGNTFGQETANSEFGPAKGDFSVAVLFGRGSYLVSGLDVPSAPGTYSFWTVSGSAPYLNSVEAGSNDVSNMLGIECRWFATDRFAVKFSGGAILRQTPSRDNIPGIIDPNAPNASWIPYYNAVQQDDRWDVNANLGGDFIFPNKKFERVFPYIGLNVPFSYGRRTQYDPTITLESDGSAIITDIGLRHAEVFGFGLQAVSGVDYDIAKGLYLGFEFKPVSFVYAYNKKYPAPGLESLNADTYTWAFFSQIYFKLGFRL